jgi:hypothetical protein
MQSLLPYIGLLALIVSIIAIIWQYFGWILGIRKDMGTMALNWKTECGVLFKDVGVLVKDVNDKSNAQDTRISRLETKMELFWNAVGDVIKNMIKQPTHFRKDELMDKLLDKRDSNISNMELVELKTILHSELPELKIQKSSQSLAYALALAYIDQILYDRGCLCAVEGEI